MESLIRNANQIKQVIDFTKVQNGKIHPSDIDAVLEFNNEALILIEVKRNNCWIPTGQRLVLERIADSWHTHKAIVLHVVHSFKEDNKNIPLHLCKVKQYYFNKEWQEDKDKTSLIKCLNGLGKSWEIEKLRFEDLSD